MGRQIDDEIRFRLVLCRVRLAARRHQPGVKFGVGIGEMRDEGAVEPNEAVAVVKIGERKPVLEDEVGHLGSGIHRQVAAALRLDRRRQIERVAAIHRDSVASGVKRDHGKRLGRRGYR